MPDYTIELDWFNNQVVLQKRAAKATNGASELRKVLRYLYEDSGPKNLTRETLRACLELLTPAEKVLAFWLQTRTNGSLRSKYGHASALAAKLARYRCQDCGFSDVRTLNLDHVTGRGSKTFRCLCANCHAIKSRAQDWTGRAREPVALDPGGIPAEGILERDVDPNCTP